MLIGRSTVPVPHPTTAFSLTVIKHTQSLSSCSSLIFSVTLNTTLALITRATKFSSLIRTCPPRYWVNYFYWNHIFNNCLLFHCNFLSWLSVCSTNVTIHLLHNSSLKSSRFKGSYSWKMTTCFLELWQFFKNISFSCCPYIL